MDGTVDSSHFIFHFVSSLVFHFENVSSEYRRSVLRQLAFGIETAYAERLSVRELKKEETELAIGCIENFG